MAGMNSPALLEPYFQHLEQCSTMRWRGRVTQVVGNTVESEGPFACVGEQCEITDSQGNTYPGEVIGFRDSKVLSMPLGRPTGLRYGDKVTTWGAHPSLRVGDGLLGRVIDGAGQPLDSLGTYRAQENWPLEGAAPLPLERTPIRQPLAVGVRAVDAFMTCGRGQRLGIFGGSGTGKSTLISMMTRNTEADLTVVALVGERGREVPEFVEESLGPEGLKRAVVVVSTSDQSPLLPIRAALAATCRIEQVQDEDAEFLRYLTHSGLRIGTAVTVLERAPFDGPVTLRVGRRKVVLGTEACRRILVSIDKAKSK